MQLIHYFDYKSPYAYLAQKSTFDIQEELNVTIDFRPYTLHIPSFLGTAELNEHNQDTIGSRNAHQWRRIHYSYMDCRREANLRGLTIRGPRKIFDSSTAHIGFLFAMRQENFRAYHERVFEQFWKRALDIESPHAIENVLKECNLDISGFQSYLAEEGRAEHDALCSQAEAQGVFGVPSYLVDDELFWGAERITYIRERLSK